MTTLLPQGGEVSLWAGWFINLPPSNYTLNEDGSWSAWGVDWAVDVTILEVNGDLSGLPVAPDKLLGPDRPVTISGTDWIGSATKLTEEDNGNTVFRCSAWLAATNTLMSCWVSYATETQDGFAEQLVRSVTHKSK